MEVHSLDMETRATRTDRLAGMEVILMVLEALDSRDTVLVDMEDLAGPTAMRL